MKDNGLLSRHRSSFKRNQADSSPLLGDHPHIHAALSRRRFIALGVGVGVASGLAGSDVGAQQDADAGDAQFDGNIESCSPAPIPVPGDPNLGGLHLWLPVPGVEPSAIFNFKGQVAVAEISGMGTLTNTNTGGESRLPFLADMRFMTGDYVGVDGKVHDGTFGFV
ncbi:MAG TPA: hypothetical protein VIX63_08520 [Vicinamibacterales bacterium]